MSSEAQLALSPQEAHLIEVAAANLIEAQRGAQDAQRALEDARNASTAAGGRLEGTVATILRLHGLDPKQYRTDIHPKEGVKIEHIGNAAVPPTSGPREPVAALPGGGPERHAVRPPSQGPAPGKNGRHPRAHRG